MGSTYRCAAHDACLRIQRLPAERKQARRDGVLQARGQVPLARLFVHMWRVMGEGRWMDVLLPNFLREGGGGYAHWPNERATEQIEYQEA